MAPLAFLAKKEIILGVPFRNSLKIGVTTFAFKLLRSMLLKYSNEEQLTKYRFFDFLNILFRDFVIELFQNEYKSGPRLLDNFVHISSLYGIIRSIGLSRPYKPESILTAC